MSATDVIATVALALSAASAVVAGISLVLQFRESARRDEELNHLRTEATRRDEELTHLRAEAGRRDEELTLMRQQLVEQRSDRDRQLRAKLTARAGSVSSSGRGIDYTLTVTNIGQHAASDIALWLLDSAATRIGQRVAVPALMPGQNAQATLTAPPPEVWLGPYGALVEWTDGRGYNEEPTGLQLGRP
jgi:hypothetical protein